MLEGLDNVDWKSLSHAYGSAEDVPDQLRALAYGDSEERESALWSFYGSIYHQGTVYKATAYAVPFLIEILTAPDFEEKHDILFLLSHLASGHSYLDAHQDFEWEQQKAQNDPEGYQSQMQEELGWVRAAHDAVYRYHAHYITLLKDEIPKTRATAAYLWACFREHHETLLPLLYERLTHETDTSVESAFILVVGYLAPHDYTAAIEVVEPYLAPDYPLLTRWAAGMTLARLMTAHAPEMALALLVNILQSGEAIEELERALKEIPWWEGGLLSATCTTLSLMGKTRILPFLPQLIGALSDIPWTGMQDVVYALLLLVFDGQPMVASLHAHDLDDPQRRTLQAIVEHAIEFRMNDDRISQNGNVLSVLRSFNVPNSRQKLLDFLNDDS